MLFRSTAAAAVASMVDPMVAAIDELVSMVGNITNYVQSGINKIIDATRYGGAALGERVQVEIQRIQQDIGMANVLGPLYAQVLKWYRELMTLIYPWRIYFSAIAAAILGTVVATLNAMAPIFKQLLQVVLDITRTVASGVLAIVGVLKQKSDVTTEEGRKSAKELSDFYMFTQQYPTLSLLSGATTAYWIAEMINDVDAPGLHSNLKSLVALLDKSLKEVEDINNKTPDQRKDSIDIFGAQLREIARKSPLYPQQGQGGPQPEFWHPPGAPTGGR